MPQLFEAFRQRKIVQWMVVYLAAAWLVLQVLDVISDNFAWPAFVMRAVIVLLAMGSIAAAIVAWFHGERGEQRVSAIEVSILAAVLLLAGAAVAFVMRNAGDEGTATVSMATPDLASVAVLPFVDMSQGKDQEYFGDGVTEEILNVLAKVPGLRVPGRTSSFSFKGKNASITEIARQLNVAHVLEGSIRKAGNKVRITAQLIDARTDRHIWSEDYDRTDADLFAVQDEIAHAIVDALQLHLGGARDTKMVAKATSNPRAHDLYLKGLYLWHRRHADELPKALANFEEAARLDPNYARAYAGIALTHSVLPQYVLTVSRTASIAAGKKAAARALELDPASADAHAALGQIAEELEWNWAEAEKQDREALRIDPNYATAHMWLAETLLVQGRVADAMHEIDAALQIEPLSPVTQNVRGYALLFAGRKAEAQALFSDMMKRDPNYPYPKTNLIRVYLDAKRYDEALSIMRNRPRVVTVIKGIQDPAKRSAALRVVADASFRLEVGDLRSGQFYLWLGLPDSAAMILDRGADRWQPSIAYAANDPLFESIRSQPAFKSFRRKLHLEQ